MKPIIAIFLFCGGGISGSLILTALYGRLYHFLPDSFSNILIGVGTGIGVTSLVYFGLSNNDLVGSILTGLISGLSMAFFSKVLNRSNIKKK